MCSCLCKFVYRGGYQPFFWARNQVAQTSSYLYLSFLSVLSYGIFAYHECVFLLSVCLLYSVWVSSVLVCSSCMCNKRKTPRRHYTQLYRYLGRCLSAHWFPHFTPSNSLHGLFDQNANSTPGVTATRWSHLPLSWRRTANELRQSAKIWNQLTKTFVSTEKIELEKSNFHFSVIVNGSSDIFEVASNFLHKVMMKLFFRDTKSDANEKKRRNACNRCCICVKIGFAIKKKNTFFPKYLIKLESISKSNGKIYEFIQILGKFFEISARRKLFEFKWIRPCISDTKNQRAFRYGAGLRKTLRTWHEGSNDHRFTLFLLSSLTMSCSQVATSYFASERW